MVTIILILIFAASISLGLPDSLLGITWPSIQTEWGLTLDAAGLISMIIIGGTIISSFLSGFVIKKIGTGKITFLSCLATGLALLGFSFAPSYIWLLLLAVPLGLGGGTVDAALNNYVALHFKSHHMNWLHSFWGVGATLGPVIMAGALATSSWQSGYRTISIIQLSLSVLLLISIPLWSKHDTIKNIDQPSKSDSSKHKLIDKEVFKTKGLKYSLAAFLFYCAAELSIGLWGSSFLIQIKNFSLDSAAYWIALYYGSITVGRFVSGFVSFKLSNAVMIKTGIIISLAGIVLLAIPLPNAVCAFPLILIGLGLAPIFPSMIHETPKRFGEDKSQIIIGYQMAFAYMGSAFLPPLFGWLFENTSMFPLPFVLFACAAAVMFCSKKLDSAIKQ